MKKNLILAAIALPLLGLSQSTVGYVGDGATVKVKSNTLLYVGDAMQVNAAGNVSNDGFINVRGAFTNGNDSDGSNFVNTWTSGTEYGQLIIDQGQQTDGKITIQFFLSEAFDYHALAYPFTLNTAEELRAQSGTTATFNANQNGTPNVFNPQRWRAPIWSWNNADHATKNRVENEILAPIDYHAVNGYSPYYSFNTTSVSNFYGTPHSQPAAATLQPYEIPTNRTLNVYGEAFGSYVEDFSQDMPAGWTTYASPSDLVINTGDYGENIYYFGNPYTSNVVVNLPTNATHIWQTTTMTYTHTDLGGPNEGVGATNVSTYLVETAAGAGDTGARSVRPFYTFGVKTSGGPITINFDESIKTFANNPNPTYDYNRNTDNLYQIGVDLYDSYGNANGNRFYIAAHTSFEAAGAQGAEAYNTWLGNKTGFTVKQENADGSVAPTQDNMYINGINTYSYVAKPIYASFQNGGEAGTTFTIKARLNNHLLNSSNKFYFEDVQEGFITEVTEDFEYSFTSADSNEDRFRFYWNGLPETLGSSDVAVEAQTIIYKDGKEHKVRFDRTWNSADIYVYSISGQLIHTAKNLPTNQDYLLPLRGQTTMYVVKAVSEDGVVVTKKVIK